MPQNNIKPIQIIAFYYLDNSSMCAHIKFHLFYFWLFETESERVRASSECCTCNERED